METLLRLFDWVVAANLRASFLTLAVLAVQPLVRHRVSPRWRSALWLPVIIVLLAPAYPESSWSIDSVAPLAPLSRPKTSLSVERGIQSGQTSSTAVAEARAPISWRQVLCWTWFGGALGMALLGGAAYAQTLWQVRRSVIPVSRTLERELAALAGELGLRRVPKVWVSPAVQSPAVTGLLRPVLLLPAQFEDLLTTDEARLVLRHEVTHIKRGDLPIHALVCALLVLHWFNPLLWLAFFKARLDRETACDAQALGGKDQIHRVAYGHTLLKVETVFGYRGLSLAFVGIFQRGAALRARIQSIASRPASHPLMKTILCLGIALMTFLGATRTAAPNPLALQILIQAKLIEDFSDDMHPHSPLPAPFDELKKTPRFVGVFTDPQFQQLIRQLSQRKGIDLLSAPRLTTKDHQRGSIEITRKFAYKDRAGRLTSKDCGIALAVLPKVMRNHQIHLDLSSEVVEFAGYANHKSGWKEPNFTERKMSAGATLTSGQTVILEMQPRTDEQTVEDTDEAGKVISSQTNHIVARLLVFVTAEVVDAGTGKPSVTKSADGVGGR